MTAATQRFFGVASVVMAAASVLAAACDAGLGSHYYSSDCSSLGVFGSIKYMFNPAVSYSCTSGQDKNAQCLHGEANQAIKIITWYGTEDCAGKGTEGPWRGGYNIPWDSLCSCPTP